jgi:hypothetical protein
MGDIKGAGGLLVNQYSYNWPPFGDGTGLDKGTYESGVAKIRQCLPNNLEEAWAIAEKLVPMITPGGPDQDFPAMEVASGLFNTLAPSTTFNLEEPPGYFSEHRFPAIQIVYDRRGATCSVAADDVWKSTFLLGYGEGQFEDLEQVVADSNQPPIHCLRWRSPEPHPPEYSDRLWWDAHQLDHGKTIDKKFLGVDERPPLIILTGFLGSGKTSFLQHFIEYQTQRSRFVAVIQNEIGEVGLDGKLLD